jgi:hypothetical protein
MDCLHLFHHDHDRHTDGPTKIVDIRDSKRLVAALMMSESLAEKIQNALCIAHEYWGFGKGVPAETMTLFEKEAKTQSWADELEHLINVTKEKVKNTGGATHEQRDELQDLLEERIKCQKAQEWN